MSSDPWHQGGRGGGRGRSEGSGNWRSGGGGRGGGRPDNSGWQSGGSSGRWDDGAERWGSGGQRWGGGGERWGGGGQAGPPHWQRGGGREGAQHWQSGSSGQGAPPPHWQRGGGDWEGPSHWQSGGREAPPQWLDGGSGQAGPREQWQIGGGGGRGGGRSPYRGTEPPSPQLLTSLIKHADTLEQLESLEHQHGAAFNSIHLSAAFVHVNKILNQQRGGYGGGGSTHASGLLRRLWQRLEPQLDRCDTRGLSNVLWACSKLGFAEPALLDGCLHRLAAAADVTTPQDLSNAVYGVALLKDSGCPAGDAAALQRLVAALVQKRHAAKPQELANTLWGAATLGMHLPEAQMQQLAAALAEKRFHAKPQEIANTLWAVATMGQQLPEAMVQHLVAALVETRWDATPQALANTLLAVATMGQQLPSDEAEQLVAALVEKRHEAKPQELANTLWACAEMWVCFPPLVEQLAAEVLERGNRAIIPRDVSNVAAALARLACGGPRMFAELMQSMEQMLQTQRPYLTQDLANLCWAVAVADHLQCAPLLLQFCRRLAADPQLWGAMVHADFSQLYQVHLWMCDWQVPTDEQPQGLADVLSPAQLQQCADEWNSRVEEVGKQQATSFQRQVYTCACCMPEILHDCRHEAPCDPDGAFSIDVAAIHAPTGRRLAIEADGPYHFLRPGRRLTGVTLARNRALAARRYVVVSIPWWEWSAVKGREEEERFLAAAVEAAIASAGVQKGAGGVHSSAAARGREAPALAAAAESPTKRKCLEASSALV